jgi:phage terminase small subunit
MPTPRKSLSELKLSGTYQMNKARYKRLTDPVGVISLPVGRPPGHLLDAERTIWAEVVKNAPEGLLGRPDRIIIEVCCKLIAQMRTADLKISELNALISTLSKLGMDPASRKKMNFQPPLPAEPIEKSAWDELDELD